MNEKKRLLLKREKKWHQSIHVYNAKKCGKNDAFEMDEKTLKLKKKIMLLYFKYKSLHLLY